MESIFIRNMKEHPLIKKILSLLGGVYNAQSIFNWFCNEGAPEETAHILLWEVVHVYRMCTMANTVIISYKSIYTKDTG